VQTARHRARRIGAGTRWDGGPGRRCRRAASRARAFSRWPVGAPARAWFAPDPRHDVASIRLQARDDRLLVSADGPVRELTAENGLAHVLAAVGERLGRGRVRSAHVQAYGGLAFSSDRLLALDERGLELTWRALRPSGTAPN
jgi:hypothetical protein